MVSDVLELARVRDAAVSGRAAELRIGARLTQGEIARAIGVSAAAVSRWESGERLPRGDAASRYAALLGALEHVCA